MEVTLLHVFFHFTSLHIFMIIISFVTYCICHCNPQIFLTMLKNEAKRVSYFALKDKFYCNAKCYKI